MLSVKLPHTRGRRLGSLLSMGCAISPPGHSYLTRAGGGWEASFPWAEPSLRLAIVTPHTREEAGKPPFHGLSHLSAWP